FGIKFKAKHSAREARAKRGGNARDLRGCRDERKWRKLELDRSRRRPLSDDNVEHSRFHSWVEHLLNRLAEPVYLVNKKNVPRVKVRKDRSKVAHFLNRGTRGDLHLSAHLAGDEVSKGCFSEARWSVAQIVLRRM